MEDELLFKVNNYEEMYVYLKKMGKLRVDQKHEDKFLWYLRH